MMDLSSGLGLLNDSAPYKDHLITRVDPRIKFFFCLAFLFVVISSKNIIIPVTLQVCMVAGLFSLGINYRVFFIRGLPAFFIAVSILVTQIFFYGKTPMFTVSLPGFQVHGYLEGFHKGALMMSRVLAGISMVLFLTLSTSISKLIFAARWFRFPPAFLEVLTITYRYIFVLFEEIASVKNAQKVRLGFSNYNRTLKSFGSIAGIVILRAIDKSEKLYKSMKSRGYNGQQIAVQYNAKFSVIDWMLTALLAVVLGAMLLFSF